MCESVYAFTGAPLNRIIFHSRLLYVSDWFWRRECHSSHVRESMLLVTLQQPALPFIQFSDFMLGANRCACLTMQNVPPALLIRFLREHRSEWADHDIDAHTATAFRNNSNGQVSRGGMSHTQLPLPLAHSGEGEVSLLSLFLSIFLILYDRCMERVLTS